MNNERRDGLASPYRGIQPFRYVDRAYFFGREETVTELLAKVLISRLVVLFGESGTGKSSLINAGLIPALVKEGFSPERLRVRPTPEEPIQIERTRLEDEEDSPFLPSVFVADESLGADDDNGSVSCSLERFVKRVQESDAYPVLIFDQFEELFTLFAQDSSTMVEEEALQADLLQAIVNTANDESLKAKVIIIIREDFLGKLEVLAKNYPQVFDRHVRLGRLDEGSARQAILRPFQGENPFPSRLTSELADRIIEGLSGNQARIRIQPTELQIVCSCLWDKYAPIRAEITVAEFEKEKKVEGILQGFLQSRLAGIEPAWRSQTIELLGRLITESGTRDIVSTERLTGALPSAPIILEDLEKNRVVYGTARRDTYYYELANEYLIQPIQKETQQLALKREREEAEKQLQLRYKKLLRWAVYIGVIVVLFVLVIFALQQWQGLNAERRKTEAREIADGAIELLEADSELSLVFASLAVSMTYSIDETATDDAEGALHQAVQVSGKQLTFSGHTGAVRDLAFSPDGKRLATASVDGSAKVWDVVSTTEVFTLPHTSSVYGLAFGPDGKRLATARADGAVTVWDVTDEEDVKKLFTLSGHSGAVWDVEFGTEEDRIATASADGTVRVWQIESNSAGDAISGRELLMISGHEDAVLGVAFSPDGKRLATASADKTAKVWQLELNPAGDTASAEELFTLSGHTGAVWDLAFSPDGKRLVTASADGTARIWDVTSDESAGEFFPISGHSGVVYDVAFSPDGNRVATASADKTAKVWLIESSSTGDAASGAEILVLSGHQGEVLGVAFSPDGKRLATASRDKTAKVWYATAGEPLLTFSGHTGEITGVAFSPKGSYVATASKDFTARIWDAASGQKLLTLSGHTAEVRDVAFGPDEKRVATASADNTARVWLIEPSSTGEATSGQKSFPLPHADTVSSVQFSPDGARLATGSWDGTVTVWDVTSEEYVKSLFTLSSHTGAVRDLAFSPDGKHLATASADRTAKVWDVTAENRGKELLTLSGHTDVVYGVAFDRKGKRLATASRDGTVTVWDIPSDKVWDIVFKREPRRLFTLFGHDHAVNDVVFSWDGKRLFTAGADNTVKVWDVASKKGGEELFSLCHHAVAVRSIARSPDGRHLATAGEDGTVRVYVLDIQRLLSLAEEHVTRPLTPTREECQEHLHRDECPRVRPSLIDRLTRFL